MGAAEDNDRIGAYRVVAELATSDTAQVLLAKAEGPMGFERTVVLKVLLEHLMSDEGSAAAFAREAAAYARLADPAIVTLYEFSEHRGRLVMALEHVDGASLADVVGVLAESGRTLDDKTALYVAQRIFSALATAHRAPIIHRDINPTNVLVSWDGEVKLTDFGFARFMGATHQSAFGMIKGTFGYMAPEQIEGGAITSRTDIYAAGIVLWELLTHQTAFERGRLSEIEALTMMAEPNLSPLDDLRPDLPQRLRNAVARALRPKSEDRDISASEMVSILRGLVPTDIGRDKLATWLERLRPQLGAAADFDDSTVSVTEPPRVSRPDVQRPRSPSGTSETAFAPNVTAKLAEQSRPLPPVRPAPTPTPPPIEESTRVMAQPAPAPPPQHPPAEPEMAPITSPMGERPRAAPPQPAPAPAPAWTPPADSPRAPLSNAMAVPSWAPPVLGTSEPPRPSSGKRTALLAAVGLLLVAAGGAAGATLYARQQAGPRVPPPPTASVALEDASAPSTTTTITSDSPSAEPVAPTPPVSASASAAPSAAPASAAPPASTPPAPAAAPAPGPAPAPAPAPSAPPDMTFVRTEGSSAGHRIFVDGRVVGQTPATVTVPCGAHDLRIGSSGALKHMDLPCGGEVTLTDR